MRDTCQTERRPLARWCGLLFVVACGRTGLEPSDLEAWDEEPGLGASAGAPADPMSTGGAAGMRPEPIPDAGTMPSTDPGPGMEPCVPVTETCNRRDDDCNGQVDDLAAEPCPGGGFRYCVHGAWSECPRSCEVCVPGSVRICQNSYCLYWGEQECAADGQGFGPCREAPPPPRCAEIARQKRNSPELERCCIDDGYCCLDLHDLDGDGDRRDLLGACDGVQCP